MLGLFAFGDHAYWLLLLHAAGSVQLVAIRLVAFNCCVPSLIGVLLIDVCPSLYTVVGAADGVAVVVDGCCGVLTSCANLPTGSVMN